MIAALLLIGLLPVDCGAALELLEQSCQGRPAAECAEQMDASLRARIQAIDFVGAELSDTQYIQTLRSHCRVWSPDSSRDDVDPAQLVARALADPRLQKGSSGSTLLEQLLRVVGGWWRALLGSSGALGAAFGLRLVFLVAMGLITALLLVRLMVTFSTSRSAATKVEPDSEIQLLQLSLADAREQLRQNQPLLALRTGIRVLTDLLVRSSALTNARTLTARELQQHSVVQDLDVDTGGKTIGALGTYQATVLARRPIENDEVQGFLDGLEQTLNRLSGESGEKHQRPG